MQVDDDGAPNGAAVPPTGLGRRRPGVQHRMQHEYTSGGGGTTATTTTMAATTSTPVNDTGLLPSPSIPAKRKQGTVEWEDQRTPTKRTSTTTSSTTGAAGSGDSGAIRCICGFTADDGLSIACDVCDRWCHAACFHIVLGEIPDEWRCWECAPRAVDRVWARKMQEERLPAIIEAQRLAREAQAAALATTATLKVPVEGQKKTRRGRRRPSVVQHQHQHQPQTPTATPGDTNDEDTVDIEESWPQSYVHIAEDIVPSEETRQNLQRQAQHWRGITALDPAPTIVKPLDPVEEVHPALSPSSNLSVRPPIYGVHTTTPVAREALISQYTSVLVPSQVYVGDSLNKYAMMGVPKPFVHLVGAPWHVALDSRMAGNHTRFVRSGCKPNAVIRPVLCSENDDEALKFGIFATKDLRENEEVVLGWEWDDGNVVHELPAIIEDPYMFSNRFNHPSSSSGTLSEAEMERVKRQVANILHTLGSTFVTCACGAKARDCAFTLMASFVNGDVPVPGSSTRPHPYSSATPTTTEDDTETDLDATPNVPLSLRRKRVGNGVLESLKTTRGFRAREKVLGTGGMGGVEEVVDDDGGNDDGVHDNDDAGVPTVRVESPGGRSRWKGKARAMDGDVEMEMEVHMEKEMRAGQQANGKHVSFVDDDTSIPPHHHAQDANPITGRRELRPPDPPPDSSSSSSSNGRMVVDAHGDEMEDEVEKRPVEEKDMPPKMRKRWIRDAVGELRSRVPVVPVVTTAKTTTTAKEAAAKGEKGVEKEKEKKGGEEVEGEKMDVDVDVEEGVSEKGKGKQREVNGTSSSSSTSTLPPPSPSSPSSSSPTPATPHEEKGKVSASMELPTPTPPSQSQAVPRKDERKVVFGPPRPPVPPPPVSASVSTSSTPSPSPASALAKLSIAQRDRGRSGLGEVVASSPSGGGAVSPTVSVGAEGKARRVTGGPPSTGAGSSPVEEEKSLVERLRRKTVEKERTRSSDGVLKEGEKDVYEGMDVDVEVGVEEEKATSGSTAMDTTMVVSPTTTTSPVSGSSPSGPAPATASTPPAPTPTPATGPAPPTTTTTTPTPVLAPTMTPKPAPASIPTQTPQQARVARRLDIWNLVDAPSEPVVDSRVEVPKSPVKSPVEEKQEKAVVTMTKDVQTEQEKRDEEKEVEDVVMEGIEEGEVKEEVEGVVVREMPNGVEDARKEGVVVESSSEPTTTTRQEEGAHNAPNDVERHEQEPSSAAEPAPTSPSITATTTVATTSPAAPPTPSSPTTSTSTPSVPPPPSSSTASRPTKVKLSLKDFAARKKKRLEEQRGDSPVVPAHVPSALEELERARAKVLKDVEGEVDLLKKGNVDVKKGEVDAKKGEVEVKREQVRDAVLGGTPATPTPTPTTPAATAGASTSPLAWGGSSTPTSAIASASWGLEGWGADVFVASAPLYSARAPAAKRWAGLSPGPLAPQAHRPVDGGWRSPPMVAPFSSSSASSASWKSPPPPGSSRSVWGTLGTRAGPPPGSASSTASAGSATWSAQAPPPSTASSTTSWGVQAPPPSSAGSSVSTSRAPRQEEVEPIDVDAVSLGDESEGEVERYGGGGYATANTPPPRPVSTSTTASSIPDAPASMRVREAAPPDRPKYRDPATVHGPSGAGRGRAGPVGWGPPPVNAPKGPKARHPASALPPSGTLLHSPGYASGPSASTPSRASSAEGPAGSNNGYGGYGNGTGNGAAVGSTAAGVKRKIPTGPASLVHGTPPIGPTGPRGWKAQQQQQQQQQQQSVPGPARDGPSRRAYSPPQVSQHLPPIQTCAQGQQQQQQQQQQIQTPARGPKPHPAAWDNDPDPEVQAWLKTRAAGIQRLREREEVDRQRQREREDPDRARRREREAERLRVYHEERELEEVRQRESQDQMHLQRMRREEELAEKTRQIVAGHLGVHGGPPGGSRVVRPRVSEYAPAGQRGVGGAGAGEERRPPTEPRAYRSAAQQAGEVRPRAYGGAGGR